VLEHWYAALRSPEGIVLRVSDFNAVRQKLYAARKEAMDPELDGLSLVQSPTDPNELWIVKKESADGPSEGD
jgi:hypothetical protein